MYPRTPVALLLAWMLAVATVGLLPSVAVAADEEAGAGPAITLPRTEVEQYDHAWFDLADFTPGANVVVELADGAGDTVASAPFTIGDDGNTANPDGQTYRRVTVPRGAVPGDDYVLRVRSAGDQVLATSEAFTVKAATTRAYNPGDHDGGIEDLLVQQGGVWTFHAVGFAPGGKLTATAVVGGQTVTLGGLGQISDAERAWQLDAQGDTSRAIFTRVQISGSVQPGELDVAFTDGTTTVTRTLTVEAPEAATVTVAETAQLGGTIRVTGRGFHHPTDGGSRIAIKINDGAYSRVDSSLHQNQTIWWVVEADGQGEFSIDMPVPNGTTADAGDTLGSTPALAPGGGYTLRFLTGALKPGDQSRTLQSTAFTVADGGAPDPVATKVSAVPVRQTYGRTARLAVVVSPNATGRISVKAGSRTVTGTLSAGRATLTIPAASLKPGRRTLPIAYTGAAGEFEPSTGSATVTVLKARPRVSVKAPKKIERGKTARFTVSVATTGARPTGRVRVTFAGKTRTVKLNARGKAVVKVKVAKSAKLGKRPVTVVYRGNAYVTAGKAKVTKVAIRR